MNKKIIVIWANCQGDSINSMLNKYYLNKFNIYSYSNYDYMKNKIKLPDFMCKCDIFIYQNYAEKNDEYDLNNILNNIIPPNAIKICFPTLHRNYLQFPFDVFSPENNKTISNKNPHGKFFYGIGVIKDLINEENNKNIKNKEEIKKYVIESIENKEFIKKNIMENYENNTIEFLKLKALNSDIPNIYDFIINNYKHIRLYHNPNHPNGILLNELCKEIFKKLNLELPNEMENIKILDNLLKDWKMPIFLSVVEYYNMKNVDNECSSFYHDDIYDIKTYIYKYIDFLLE